MMNPEDPFFGLGKDWIEHLKEEAEDRFAQLVCFRTWPMAFFRWVWGAP